MHARIVRGCWIGIAVAAICLPATWTSAQEADPAPAAADQSAEGPAIDGAPEETKEPTSALQNMHLQSLWRDNGWTRWALFVLAVLIGILAGRIAAALLRRAADQLEARGQIAWRDILAHLIGPLQVALLALLLAAGLANLKMTAPLRQFCTKTLLMLACIAVTWYLLNLASLVDWLLRRVAGATGSTLDRELAPMIRKGLRVLLVVLALLFMIDSVFEKDIGAWLAGLGIAGLAVSLAAQDSLKSLLGSFTILLDRPFRVGDGIVFGGYEGVIEEIGFRSTRLRTYNGHLVVIPNSKIASEAVENPARRPYIRRVVNLAIACDTPHTKIDDVVQAIRELLEQPGIREPLHPVINGNEYRPRVHFNEFNKDHLNIQITYWYAPAVYWDYMQHAQELNLRIVEVLTKAGVRFGALPAPPPST